LQYIKKGNYPGILPPRHQDYRIILYNSLFNEGHIKMNKKTPLFNLYLSSPTAVRWAGLWVFVAE